MSSVKFLANVPQNVQFGDKITVIGVLAHNADEFSINFANDTCAHAFNITYHFKWILPENIIVQNCKLNNKWMEHTEMSYYPLDGRFTNGLNTSNDINANDTYSILGGKFQLEFLFLDDGIYVYNHDGHNMIAKYESYFEYSDIKSVQVWGDVERIQELAFSYP